MLTLIYSQWGDKKTSTKEKVEDQGQTGILDVLGSFIQDYTPDDINRTLDSYTVSFKYHQYSILTLIKTYVTQIFFCLTGKNNAAREEKND